MKITLIGGGSYSWTKGLHALFVHNPFFGRDTELCLMDIAEEPLNDMYDYCGLYNKKYPNGAVGVTKTMSLEEGLENADYVIVAISHGGLDAELEDHRIARKYGFYNIKGSEAGIAGASRTVRHVPELVRIAKKMKEICPEAMMFNVTNPLTALTRAVHQYAGVHAAGFCHGVCNHLEMLLPYFGAKSMDEISFEVGGVDHASFLTEVNFQGRDALEIMREKGMIEEAWKGKTIGVYDDPFAGRENQRIRFILWDILGVMPAISDEHCGEFYYQIIGTPELREKFGMHYDRIIERQNTVKNAKKYVRDCITSGKLPDEGAVGGEIIDRMIEALKGGRQFNDVINYRNKGQILSMPADTVVETFCQADATGIHPRVIRPLPKIAESIVLPIALREELYMEAAMEQNEQKLISALAMDPIVNDFLKVKDVAREILDYNRRFLVNFA